MKHYVTDTHPLVWYISKQARKLPSKIKRVFDDAVDNQATIWIPLVVLWEMSLLLKARRFKMDVSLEELITNNFFAKAIYLIDFLPEDIVRASKLSFSRDPFDTLILACAQRLELPLITGDLMLHESGLCQIYW